jgi:hypothetical protein
MEMSLNDHLRLRSAAPAKLLTQSRYAALFVSLHGTALCERRDLARMPPADAGVVRAYLARERALQERLITTEQEHSQRQRPRPQIVHTARLRRSDMRSRSPLENQQRPGSPARGWRRCSRSSLVQCEP